MANYIYITTEDTINDRSYLDAYLERGQDIKSQLMFFSKPEFRLVRLNLLCEASGDVGAYNQLNKTAFDASCEYSVTCPILDEIYLIQEFITDSGYPLLDMLLSGTWILYIRAKGYSAPIPPNPPDPFTFFRVYKRDAGGTETLLFSSFETPMPNNNLYANYSISRASTGTLATDDRIVLKVYGVFRPVFIP